MEEEKKKLIKVYTSPTCHYCHLVKDFLGERGVEFEDIDVTRDPKMIEELVKKTGHMGVPVIEFPSGEIVVGFDQESLERLI